MFTLQDQPTIYLDCDTYGTYTVRRVGRINVLKCDDATAYFRWCGKYHPRYYFGFIYSTDKTFLDNETHVYAWDVYLPLLEDNTEWELKDSLYYKNCIEHNIKPTKKLPIAFSHKAVFKWRDKSIEHLDI